MGGWWGWVVDLISSSKVFIVSNMHERPAASRLSARVLGWACRMLRCKWCYLVITEYIHDIIYGLSGGGRGRM